MKAAKSAGTILLMISMGSIALNAQINFFKYELGISAGTFVYQGDLTPQYMGSYKTLKPVLNIYMNEIISPVFLLRTNLALGGLKGDDAKYSSPAYRLQRNFNFRSPVFELSELVVADILQNNMTKHPGLSPYLFAGAGLSVLNIKRDYSRFNGEYFSAETATLNGLTADAQHSPPHLIPVLPMGIGVRYALTQKILICVETLYRFTFTDYLDGFSKAAGASKKDSYQGNTIGIIYRFIKKNDPMRCPVF